MAIFACQTCERATVSNRPYRLRVAFLAAALVVLGMTSLALSGALETTQSTQDWQEFVDKKLGYRATFPGPPLEKISNLRDETGDAHEVYNCSVEWNETKYAVQCELQGYEMKSEQTGKMVKNAIAKRSGMKNVKSANEVKLGDYAGFETVELGGLKVRTESRTRHFWIGKMNYLVYVRAPEGGMDEQAATRFLDSFQLLSADEKKRETGDKVLARDTFSGPRGMFLVRHFMDVGTGWKTYGRGAWRIVNQQARMTTHSAQDVIATDAGEPNATLTCDLTTSPREGMDAGLVVRLVDNNNYWMFAIRDNRVETYKKSAGSYISYGVPPFTFRPSTTYHLKITVDGNTLTAFVGAQQVMQVTMDAFQTATRFGFRDNSSPRCQPSWDNFEVTRP
jgi:hypothetical protein